MCKLQLNVHTLQLVQYNATPHAKFTVVISHYEHVGTINSITAVLASMLSVIYLFCKFDQKMAQISIFQNLMTPTPLVTPCMQPCMQIWRLLIK